MLSSSTGPWWFFSLVSRTIYFGVGEYLLGFSFKSKPIYTKRMFLTWTNTPHYSIWGRLWFFRWPSLPFSSGSTKDDNCLWSCRRSHQNQRPRIYICWGTITKGIVYMRLNHIRNRRKWRTITVWGTPGTQRVVGILFALRQLCPSKLFEAPWKTNK